MCKDVMNWNGLSICNFLWTYLEWYQYQEYTNNNDIFELVAVRFPTGAILMKEWCWILCCGDLLASQLNLLCRVFMSYVGGSERTWARAMQYWYYMTVKHYNLMCQSGTLIHNNHFFPLEVYLSTTSIVQVETGAFGQLHKVEPENIFKSQPALTSESWLWRASGKYSRWIMINTV